MSIKTSSQIINGKTVKIVLLKTLDGIKISKEISKVAVPAITALQQSDGDITQLAVALVNNLDSIDLGAIIIKLFDGATVDEFPINVDDYFAGNYGELVGFLTFALKANFESFFSLDSLSDLLTSAAAA